MTGGFILLLVVMVGAGFLGGIVNFLLISPDIPDANAPAAQKDWGKDPLFYKSLFLGVAASLVVPVFLQIAAVGADNSLITTFLGHFTNSCDKDIDPLCDTTTLATAYSSLATIGGFCILAAVGSRNFLESLSKRLLDQANNTANEARNIARESDERAEQIEVGLTRELDARMQSLADKAGAELDEEGPEDDVPITRSAIRAFTKNTNTQLTTLDRDIMNALAEKPNTRRSIKGIRADSETANTAGPLEVGRRLHMLAGLGYVERLQPTEPGSTLPRWKLSTKGWAETQIK